VPKLETVLVVGASLAGLRAVQALRRAGYDGRIQAIGAERHLPYDRPPLSKQVLAGAWDAERIALLRPGEEAELGVAWRLGARAAGLDLAARRVRLEGGEEVPFDGLVIATGAAARGLPGTPPGLAGVHTLRTLEDSLALRAAFDRGPRVAVIGAGFIGAEVAATCRGRGLEVTLIEALAAPLEHALGAAAGRVIAELHRDHGVDVRLGAPVAGLEGAGRVERVRLADGTALEADLVVVGIGVAPATAWLEGSGLALRDGVVCDAACAAAPGVVAAGDVARWPNPRFGESMRIEHWTNATEQADAAVATLLSGRGAAEPYAPVPFFWSDQYDRKIQFAGRAAPGDETALVDGSLEERRFVLLYGRRGRLCGVLGLNRPRLVMHYRERIRAGARFEEALASR
jgi:3-phenylpropionate/trans-cinnamate dioxygenase ferredoxin reductase component